MPASPTTQAINPHVYKSLAYDPAKSFAPVAGITLGAQVYVTGAGAIVDTVGSNTIATGWFFDTTALNGGLVRIAKR